MMRKYGWIPDVPDCRDFDFLSLINPLTLPMSVDLRPSAPPIKDQGALGSCTSNALTTAIEFLELKDKYPYVPMSRLFVYYNERDLEGCIQSDSGAQIRDGIKTLNLKGVCLESDWPYDTSKFSVTPSDLCYAQAQGHDLVSYERLNTLTDCKICLSDGYPFVFGFSVYESFESEAVAKTGIVNMPSFGERMVGGHAVCCMGYDDNKQVLIVQNSWGTGWGDKGFFYLPYGFVVDRDMSDDYWTLKKTNSE